MIEREKVAATEIVCCHEQSVYVCLLGIHKLLYDRNFFLICVFFVLMWKGIEIHVFHWNN